MARVGCIRCSSIFFQAPASQRPLGAHQAPGCKKVSRGFTYFMPCGERIISMLVFFYGETEAQQERVTWSQSHRKEVAKLGHLALGLSP